jgi:hypothetical protein
LSYWEDRTKFIMAGNLTPAVATQQAYTDPEREARYIGLISGDYLMLPQKHTDDLAKELPNLDLIQGYLVRKDADPSLPLETRAQNAVPGITYASMRVSVEPITGNSASKPEPTSDSGSDSADDSPTPSGKGGGKSGGSTSHSGGSGPKKGAGGKTK